MFIRIKTEFERDLIVPDNATPEQIERLVTEDMDRIEICNDLGIYPCGMTYKIIEETAKTIIKNYKLMVVIPRAFKVRYCESKEVIQEKIREWILERGLASDVESIHWDYTFEPIEEAIEGIICVGFVLRTLSSISLKSDAPRAEINLEALKWVKRKNLLGECSSVHWSEEGEDNFYRV